MTTRRGIPGELDIASLDNSAANVSVASVEEVDSAPAPGAAGERVEPPSVPSVGNADARPVVHGEAMVTNGTEAQSVLSGHPLSGTEGPGAPSSPPSSRTSTPSFTLRRVDWSEVREDGDNVGGGIPASWCDRVNLQPNMLIDILSGIEDANERFAVLDYHLMKTKESKKQSPEDKAVRDADDSSRAMISEEVPSPHAKAARFAPVTGPDEVLVMRTVGTTEGHIENVPADSRNHSAKEVRSTISPSDVVRGAKTITTIKSEPHVGRAGSQVPSTGYIQTILGGDPPGSDPSDSSSDSGNDSDDERISDTSSARSDTSLNTRQRKKLKRKLYKASRRIKSKHENKLPKGVRIEEPSRWDGTPNYDRNEAKTVLKTSTVTSPNIETAAALAAESRGDSNRNLNAASLHRASTAITQAGDSANRIRKSPNTPGINNTSSGGTATKNNIRGISTNQRRLSQTEMDELRSAGKCFNCREVGHNSRNCPDRHSARAPRLRSANIRASSVNIGRLEQLTKEQDTMLKLSACRLERLAPDPACNPEGVGSLLGDNEVLAIDVRFLVYFVSDDIVILDREQNSTFCLPLLWFRRKRFRQFFRRLPSYLEGLLALKDNDDFVVSDIDMSSQSDAPWFSLEHINSELCSQANSEDDLVARQILLEGDNESESGEEQADESTCSSMPSLVTVSDSTVSGSTDSLVRAVWHFLL
ncbi:hypothetical protein GLOTRDRAFT_134407 [Gloeophyllum trabeum ATCC 11539]|uniref:CCHC-type domain-containing protein n=1 Tax=Gloeophyllum trabeum (strain ATCC 11539 / FP-39264 / Madison 617) TaxID=670483 RepID=S7PPW5_GLOTA|nr:uncharacterized protein GLOTRDRAFT_134407 [Gloeophyllum trabeum ATCC 11539]EPQ49956.1 hypothetical protein GLOTRDRAFT_134407 [Gloeophyllum trabeum ATCC 11539]